VRAERLEPGAILRTIAAGDFYASTGVSLADVRRGRDRLAVEVAPEEGVAFAVRFIGRGGETLAESTERAAEYRAKGGEGYGRARVDDAKGRRAWTQPVFLRAR
jgi:hypothetical protein